jgi:pimeloyl-ACP methyl ester carboxylesterase
MRKVTVVAGACVGACAAFVSLRWLRRTREDTRWEDAKSPGKLLDIDGVKIHYVEKGSGPAIVMVHGFGGATFSFRYQFDSLSSDHRCVAIDLKGFGFSQRPEGGDYSLTAQANLVLRAMDLLGIDRCVLMGHSMGGDVSMRIATIAPQRVEKLILAASSPGIKIWVMPRLRFLRPLLRLTIRASLSRYRKRLFYDSKLLDADAIMRGYLATARIKGSFNTVWEMWDGIRHDKPIEYRQITMPTLILWAEKERVIPFPGFSLRWLRKKLPRAEVVTVPRTGHLLLEERPEVCISAIRRFLAGATPDQVREAALGVPTVA